MYDASARRGMPETEVTDLSRRMAVSARAQLSYLRLSWRRSSGLTQSIDLMMRSILTTLEREEGAAPAQLAEASQACEATAAALLARGEQRACTQLRRVARELSDVAEANIDRQGPVRYTRDDRSGVHLVTDYARGSRGNLR